MPVRPHGSGRHERPQLRSAPQRVDGSRSDDGPGPGGRCRPPRGRRHAPTARHPQPVGSAEVPRHEHDRQGGPCDGRCGRSPRVLGYNYLVAPNVGGPRLFAPDPTPTPSPSILAAIDFTQHAGEGRALQPGSYLRRLRRAGERHHHRARRAVRSDTPPPGTRPCSTGVRGTRPAARGSDLGMSRTSESTPVIRDQAGRTLPLGQVSPTWSRRLSAIPIMDVTQSSATLDGHSGELLEITGTERPAGCSDAPILWETTQGDEALSRVRANTCECGSSTSRGIASWCGPVRTMTIRRRRTICRP